MTKKSFPLTVLISLSVLIPGLLIPFSSIHADLVGSKIDVEATVQQGRLPDVACDTINNRYLVVYEFNDGINKEILYTLRNSDGSALTAPAPINNHPGQPDSQPAVAYQPTTQQYLVVWSYGTAAGSDIYGQRVDKDGNLTGPPIQIAIMPGEEVEPDVAANPAANGHFMVGYLRVSTSVDIVQLVSNNGLVQGPASILFTNVRMGPRIAYGSDALANFFVTSSINTQKQVMARKVQGIPVGPPLQVNLAQAAIGSGFAPSLAYHQAFNRWLVVWVNGVNKALRGRYVLPGMAPSPAGNEIFINMAGVPISSVDVAAGHTQASVGRYNVAFARNNEIFAIWVDGNGVSGAPENLSMDMEPDTRPAIAYNKTPKLFFSVWQHETAFSMDIHGQIHKLP